MQIAGGRTDDQWNMLRPTLEANRNDAALWGAAFDDYHMRRIDTRYFQPIAAIDGLGKSLGEGFAVVALFCSLIEFLETTEQGKNFKPSQPRSPHEYGSGDSRNLFTSFLEKRIPFQSAFENQSHGSLSLANSFYSGVRCGVLHEAKTCGGWLIRNEGSNALLTTMSDGTVKLHRNRLKPMLDLYLSDFRKRLLAEPATQDAFVRRWNHLCQP